MIQAEDFTANEAQIGNPKGLAFDFGQSEQNVDQSFTYTVTGNDQPGIGSVLAGNPTIIYIVAGLLGFYLVVSLLSKKKRK